MSKEKKIFNLSVQESPDSKTATIYLYGYIGVNWWNSEETQNTDENFIKQINDLQSKYERIDIHINSPGGDMMHGNAIVTAIQNSKAEIHTYNDGMAGSMAAVIFCAAPEGNRHMAKNAITMIHSPSSGIWGTAKTLRNEADILDKFQSTIVAIIAQATKKTEAVVVTEYMDYEDHYLTYSDCLAAGIVADGDYEVEENNVVQSLITYNNVLKIGSQHKVAAALYNIKTNNMSVENDDLNEVKDEVIKDATEVVVEDAAEVNANTERIAQLEKELEDARAQNKKISAAVSKTTIVPMTAENGGQAKKTQDEIDLEKYNKEISDSIDRNQNFKFD